MRADADADAGAETPLELHQPKRPKRCDMIRHDITRAYSRFTNTQRTSAFSRYTDFRFSAHEPSLDLGRSRFKNKPDCVVCQQAIYERWHYYSISTVGCRVGWCRVRRRRRASMRWQAWQAWRPRACGMRQIRWFMLGCILACEYATMHIHACRPVGWATGAWRGQSDGCRSSSISNSCRQAVFLAAVSAAAV